MVDSTLTEVIPTKPLHSFPVFAKEPLDERETSIIWRDCQYGRFISSSGNIADSGGRAM